MRALSIVLVASSIVSGCVVGTAGSDPGTDASEPEEQASAFARAGMLGQGEDVLDARVPSETSTPWEEPEPETFDSEPEEELVLAPFERSEAIDPETSTPIVGAGAWPPPSSDELSLLARSGVRRARVLLPYREDIDYADPDPAYVARIDGLFADAARAEITLLPVLASSTAVPAMTDESLTRWGDFAFWAASRYGAEGELWHERAELPYHAVEAWEVWTEPNHPAFWPTESGVDPAHYRALLLYARVGLRDGDPTARVLVGGLAPSSMDDAMRPTEFLRALLDAPDASSMFDAVALHGFGDVEEVLADIEGVHRVLVDHGLSGRGRAADVPIWLTEVGWAIESPPDCASRDASGRCEGHEPYSVADEAAQAERLQALLAVIDSHRAEWRIGPVYWHAWRDRTLEESGGIETWARHTGLFAIDGGVPRARPALAALVAPTYTSVALPIVREAPSRSGFVRTNDPDRLARRDEGPSRVRRRGRKRAFRRPVIGRMYHLGACVNGEGRLREGCSSWTLPEADRYEVERYPDLLERRAAYVCQALRRLRPSYVSGLVRFSYEDVFSADPAVQEEIAREAEVFRRVRACVQRGRDQRVRFDVVLNALNFSHEGYGVTSAADGTRRHREMLAALHETFRFEPDAWFYDFYTEPFEHDRHCYARDTRCGRFYPDGMRAGIGWAHNHGQWIGGNTFSGERIPDGTDFVSLTDAGGLGRVALDRRRARTGRPDLPILMHIRNDPQSGCSEGLAFLHRGEAYRRRVLRAHVDHQDDIGYAYMYPAFFPMRFARRDPRPDPERCDGGEHNYAELGVITGMRSYDADRDGTLARMRWYLDHRRAHP